MSAIHVDSSHAPLFIVRVNRLPSMPELLWAMEEVERLAVNLSAVITVADVRGIEQNPPGELRHMVQEHLLRIQYLMQDKHHVEFLSVQGRWAHLALRAISWVVPRDSRHFNSYDEALSAAIKYCEEQYLIIPSMYALIPSKKMKLRMIS